MSSVWKAVQKSLPGWWCGTIRRCRRRSPCDEHRELAVPGAGVRCAEEPFGLYRRLLHVDTSRSRTTICSAPSCARWGRWRSFPRRIGVRLVHVLAVEDHTLVATLARHGISAIENPKLRWPEAGELCARPNDAGPGPASGRRALAGRGITGGRGWDSRERIVAIMRTGQQAPLTSSQRLCDERLGRAHVRDSIEAVAEVPRCRAVAAGRLQACA